MSDVSQTLDRGLQVLEIVDTAKEPIGVRDIARQVDFGTSIVQRLVNTLEARGYVEQVAETRRYKVGHRSVLLGQSSRHGDTLNRVAHAQLLKLAETHGLNGYLGVLSGDRPVYVLSVPSRHRFILRIDPGETMDWHATAMGRVLLAAQSDERVRQLLSAAPMVRNTEKTITDPETIIGLLPAVRRNGFASVDEENLPGVVSVGAPVRDEAGNVVAGVSVAYAKGTSDMDITTVSGLITDTARNISRTLGCPEDLIEGREDEHV